MKIEKLELKYLASYLAYRLHVDIIDNEYVPSDKNVELYRLETGRNKTNTSYGEFAIVGDYELELEHFKPLLRPLSQLTEEIVVNGEKFVPLERLALSLEYDVEPWDIDDRIGYFFDDNTFDDSQGYEVCISKDLKFEVWYDDKNSGSMQSATALTYSHIQLLLEWHFDLFDLIENNLAIEKK